MTSLRKLVSSFSRGDYPAKTLVGLLFLGACSEGTLVAQPIEPRELRAPAGESRTTLWRGSGPLVAITSTRTTPEMHFPIRVEITGEPAEQKLRFVIPPATPPGEYSVEVAGVSAAGQISTASIQLTVDPVKLLATPARPPVILLNGFQLICTDTSSTLTASEDTFGQLDYLLQYDGSSVLFFNNCAYGDISIEQLGSQLGAYIAGLRYTDGTPVPEVDLVAHSMGGLIARAYLSGKSQASGVFSPPANPMVRKLVMIGTPNFGSFQSPATGVQLSELALGSQFLWDLATWNQGLDDLRGVDALAIIGNAGTYGNTANVSDGVVSLTSGSLGFVEPDPRTRIVPYCHIPPGSNLFTEIGIGMSCSVPEGIAYIDSPSHLSAQIVRSFLADTTDWQSIGSTPSADPYLSHYGGLDFLFKSSDDAPVTNIDTVEYNAGNGVVKFGEGIGSAIFYNEWMPAQSVQLQMLSGSSLLGTVPFTETVGGFIPLTVKTGPIIYIVQPAAAGVSTLSVAPGSLISIYGTNMASTTAQASSLPLPPQLSDTTVTVNGQHIGLLYVSPGQINAYMPPNLSGFIRVTISNSLGQHSLNVLLAAAVPALFSMDGTGTGLVAGINATTGSVLSQSRPVHAGDIVSLYLTGMGNTVHVGSFDTTVITPSVYINPLTTPARIQYSGLAPGFVGLYQINVEIPAGTQKGSAVPLVVGAGKYFSNVVTIPIQ